MTGRDCAGLLARGVSLAVLGMLAGVVGVCGQAPSASQARMAIESAQPEPGEEGLGSLTMSELMVRFGVPGVSVAVIHDFDIHWSTGYGAADIETGRRVDSETMFQAASISKPVAAMATVRAVQDGLFGLDDDINDILRSWTLAGEGFTTTRRVTPRGLTSHTSGLGDGFGFPGYAPDAELPTTVQILEGHDRSNVGDVFMEREPLTFYEYSGGGVTVMELALADAREMPFDELMQTYVLGPIGMTRSSYEQPISTANDRNAARAHDREGQSMGPKWHVYPEMAAAGLWTTPSDLARFAIDIQKTVQGDGGAVLERQMVDEMLRPVGVGPYAVGFSIGPLGQGWYFGHGGSNWGFRAQLLAHTAKGYGFAIMTNADQGSALIAELSRRIQRVYGWDSVAEGVRRGYRR